MIIGDSSRVAARFSAFPDEGGQILETWNDLLGL